MAKKRVLSCIQPTGEMHLGNYFGAIKNWVDIQNTYDCVYGVVDLHAMTMPYNPKELYKNTTQMIVDLLACGIDPMKSVLFIQSLVPQHSELTWVFNCVCSYGELARMTQFKDKSQQLEETAKGNFVSAGLFTYPVLQAADILIYKAELVPVGKDQEQHLELSRNIAVRFNNQFGEYFPEPQPLFTEIPKLLSIADPTKKMSKSLGDKHVIGLFESEESIRKKIKSAVTDTGEDTLEMSKGVENLFNLLKASGFENDYNSLMNDYNNGNRRYAPMKEAVANALVSITQGFIKKRLEIMTNQSDLEKLVTRLSEQAMDIASQTINDVKRLTGLRYKNNSN